MLDIYKYIGGDQLLSLEFSKIDLFLLNLACIAGPLSPHNFLCPTKILHLQPKVSPVELSLSRFTISRCRAQRLQSTAGPRPVKIPQNGFGSVKKTSYRPVNIFMFKKNV